MICQIGCLGSTEEFIFSLKQARRERCEETQKFLEPIAHIKPKKELPTVREGVISKKELEALRKNSLEVALPDGRKVMLDPEKAEVRVRDGVQRFDVRAVGSAEALRNADFAANSYGAYIAVGGKLYTIDFKRGKVEGEILEDVERKEGRLGRMALSAGEESFFVVPDGGGGLYAFSSVKRRIDYVPLKTIRSQEGSIENPSIAYLNGFVFITGNGKHGVFKNLYAVDVSALGSGKGVPVIIRSIPFF